MDSTFSIAPDLLIQKQQLIFCFLLVFQKSHKCCTFASASLPLSCLLLKQIICVAIKVLTLKLCMQADDLL